MAGIGLGIGIFPFPAHSDGMCAKSQVNGTLLDVGWCRLHEKGPTGETVYIYTNQQHKHERPRQVYLSYDRKSSYLRYLFDCQTRELAKVSPKNEIENFARISSPLHLEIYESVCVEKNTIITKPYAPPKWQPPSAPPPNSL